jgi:hypothetical protein
VRGWDWGPNNTRLITGLSADSFLEVQANGNLSKWVTHGASYREIPLPATGFHEGETRQVSGISGFVGGGGGAFYELNNFSEISRWSWAYDGASFEEEKFGTQGHEIWFIV